MVPKEASHKFKCKECDWSSPKRFLLKRHSKTHSEERPFECSDCNSCFERPGMNCIKIGLLGKLIFSKRKGLWKVLFS